MLRRDPNRKLNFQKTQIRSILSDFRKAKHKCIAIYDQLNEEMPDKVRFDSVQKQTILKMELLDLPGLAALKNTLLKTLNQLFDLQSQISTKKQRIAARKQFGGIPPYKNLAGNSQYHPNKNMSFNQTQTNRRHFDEDEEEAYKAGATNKMSRQQKQRQLKLPLPTYNMKKQNNVNKLDRISKFVENLEKSMKDQSYDKQQDVKLRQILMKQPQYCKIKQQLERYKMRQQQIEYLIEQRVKQKIAQFCEDMQIIEQTNNYKIVKIFKNQDYDFSEGSKKNLSQSQIIQNRSLHSMVLPKTTKPIYQRKKQNSLDIATILKQQPEKDKDIVAIEEELSKEAYNVEDIVSKISSTLQNSELRLKELRQQRKKIFMDDDIWDEFEKM